MESHLRNTTCETKIEEHKYKSSSVDSWQKVYHKSLENNQFYKEDLLDFGGNWIKIRNNWNCLEDKWKIKLYFSRFFYRITCSIALHNVDSGYIVKMPSALVGKPVRSCFPVKMVA